MSLRILVVPLRFIGDCVLTIPLLRNIKHHFPHAEVDILIPQTLQSLFENCPYVSRIILEPKSKIQLLKILRKNPYDIGFLLRRSLTQAFMLKQAGIKRLIGYDEQRLFQPIGFKRCGLFLDQTVPFPPLDTDIPQVKTYLNLLSPLGLLPHDEFLELWPSEEDVKVVERSLEEASLGDTQRSIAVFHATSASREKAMAPDRFLPALKKLQDSNFRILAIGTAQDAAYYDFFKAQGIVLENLCGKTTLSQSYVLLQRAQVLFSLDSAPVHLAAAAGTSNIVAIYGPTNEKQWRPYPYDGRFIPVTNKTLTCRPCLPKVCEHNLCREGLTAWDIAQGVQQFLDQPSRTAMASSDR